MAGIDIEEKRSRAKKTAATTQPATVQPQPGATPLNDPGIGVLPMGPKPIAEAGGPTINPPPTDLNYNNPGQVGPHKPLSGDAGLDALKAKMKAAGVSDHVIGDEAAYVFGKYGNSDDVFNTSLQNWLARSNDGHLGGNVVGGVASGGPSHLSGFGNYFDDPHTKQLEELLKQQTAQINAPNPQLAQLLDFLTKQFESHAANPGYSPDELAVMRTQAFEPVEAYRQASQRRALEQAGARGFLPTSGLLAQQQMDIDMASDRNRTALDRDLAINQINERNNDIQRALSFGQQAYQIPYADQRQRQADTLQRSQMLYNIPRQAMLDAMSFLNGGVNTSDLFNQANSASQFGLQLQQQNNAQSAAFWQAIGNLLAQFG